MGHRRKRPKVCFRYKGSNLQEAGACRTGNLAFVQNKNLHAFLDLLTPIRLNINILDKYVLSPRPCHRIHERSSKRLGNDLTYRYRSQLTISTGRESCFVCGRWLLTLRRQDREIRKRSRPLHTSSQCIPTPKSRQRGGTSLRAGSSNPIKQPERTRRCGQHINRSV